MDLRPLTNTPPAAPVVPGTSGKSAPAVSTASAPVPTQTTQAVRQADKAPDEKEVSEALSSINNAMQVRSQDLQFSVDKDSAQRIVTVTDKNTKEVIRQMPTREALEIAKALDRLQSLLVRESA